MNKYIDFIFENLPGKKHIFITGTRGSGKTTLINELKEQIASNGSIPGMITWCVPGKAVYLRKMEEEEAIKIGEFDPHIMSENKMTPVSGAFDLHGTAIFEDLMNASSEWVLIDEIGFLEGGSKLFLQKLDELFERKKVMAVVRKQEIEHLNRILHRTDALVIDLDLF